MRTPMPPVACVISFIDAINRGDVDRLGTLMDDDHQLQVLDEPATRPQRLTVKARRAASLLVAATLVLAACSSSSKAKSGSPTTRPPATATTATTGSGANQPTATTVARDAFLAGYPLVVTDRTMQTFAGLAGVNRLLRVPRLSTISSRFVVAPNHDTVYAIAILDLRRQPQALTIPLINRYYTFQFIDAWMDTVTNVGTRATGGKAGTWVVVPPGFKGNLPAGTHRIDSPTNQLIVLGRVRAVDDADAPAAFAATSGVLLRPLSALGGRTSSSPPPAMPKPAGTPQTVGQNGLAAFDELGDDLGVNPPVSAEQRRAINAARSLGVGAGLHPSQTATAAQRRTLLAGVREANAAVASGNGVGAKVVNGWAVNLTLGNPNAHPDLLSQAIIAKHYWGPNVAAESVYPVARTASDGQPLTGAKNYVIRLAAGNLPPVKAFWSYTVYGPDSFFVANPINRYSLSGDTPGLVRGPDGSIDLYLSHTSPPDHTANWLPTPAGPYRLVMRLYLPGPTVLNGTYRYPAVTVVPS